MMGRGMAIRKNIYTFENDDDDVEHAQQIINYSFTGSGIFRNIRAKKKKFFFIAAEYVYIVRKVQVRLY